MKSKKGKASLCQCFLRHDWLTNFCGIKIWQLHIVNCQTHLNCSRDKFVYFILELYHKMPHKLLDKIVVLQPENTSKFIIR